MKWKIAPAFQFWANLPDLSVTAPQVETPSETAIGIIPVFTDAYFSEHSFVAYLKAAIYSRQTFLLHADAYKTQTAVKLYIEETLKASTLPILEGNGLIPETDVLYFQAPPLPDTQGGIYGRLGKKLSFMYDPRLATYQRVVYWDADMFFREDVGDHKQLFTRLIAAAPQLYAIRITHFERPSQWKRWIIPKMVHKTYRGGIELQEIFDRAGLGRVLQTIKGPISKPLGGLGSYPAATFHTEHKDFVRWLHDHGPYIGDDEIALMLAAAFFGHPIGSIQEQWGYNFSNVHGYQQHGHRYTFVHGRPIIGDDYHAYRELLSTLTTLD